MKRIVLDHFRRRAWLFAVGAFAQLGLGWALALFTALGETNPLGIIQGQIAIFMGAILLATDLNRGIARTLATLPLTPREIGRAWWLATVAIPAPFFSALLVLGALAHHLVYPDTAIVWDQLAGTALTLLLLLGAAFTLVLKLPAHPGEARGWQRVLNQAIGAAWALLFFCGYWFFSDLTDSPYRLISFLFIGVALTVIGWFRAGHFMLGRATARPIATDTAPRPATPYRSGGLGGLPLLLGGNFLRVFLSALGILVAILLVTALQGRIHSWTELAKHISRVGYSPMGFLVFLFLAPTFQQLRLLRSLPLSTNALAATLLALIILPLLAIGILTTSLSAWSLGPTETRIAAMGCLLALPPAGWMVAVITWQGLRTSTRVLLFLLMIAGQFGFIWLQMYRPGVRETGPSLGLAALISAAGVALAFYLTRLAIQRGTLAYRTPVVGGFTPAWAAGR